MHALAPRLCCELTHTRAQAELVGGVVLLAAGGVNCGKGLACMYGPLPLFVQAFPDYEGCCALLFLIFQM